MENISVDTIFHAGIVGGGGAGFPTWKKLNVQVEWLLINGAECEPLLKSDQYIMQTQSHALIKAAYAIAGLTGAQRSVIALKRTYQKEFQALEQAIHRAAAPIELFQMRPVYPAGDEQVVVREATGLTVPPGGIPLDVGCVVISVSTLLAIAEAMDGHPSIKRYVTVAGEVDSSQVFYVPVGTFVKDLITAANTLVNRDTRIVMGGPMMGSVVPHGLENEAVITKKDGGVLVLPPTHMLIQRAETPIAVINRRARSVCVQCQQCTETCPRHLLGHPLQPHKIMRVIAYGGSLDDAAGALLCSECGICEIFACPMGLSPRRVNAELKAALREKQISPRFEMQEMSAPVRDCRQIHAHRAAIRAGVAIYDIPVPQSVRALTPTQVSIPLRQHVGAPCEPIVRVGDFVSVGQAIGTVPEGALGAPVHASINGVVKQVGASITITAREVEK